MKLQKACTNMYGYITRTLLTTSIHVPWWALAIRACHSPVIFLGFNKFVGQGRETLQLPRTKRDLDVRERWRRRSSKTKVQLKLFTPTVNLLVGLCQTPAWCMQHCWKQSWQHCILQVTFFHKRKIALGQCLKCYLCSVADCTFHLLHTPPLNWMLQFCKQTGL